MKLSAAVLALGAAGLASVAQADQGAIAVTGHGVKTSASGEGVVAKLSDVARITSRILGFDAALESGDKAVLPTGDLLDRAKACLLVTVDGLDYNAVRASSESAKFLGELFSNDDKVVKIDSTHVEPIEGEDAKLKQALSVGSSDLKSVSSRHFADSLFLSASGSGKTVNGANAKTKLHTCTGSLDEELALFSQVFSSLPEAYVEDESPDVIHIGVSSLRNGFSTEDLTKLDGALEKLNADLNKLYGGRMATQVVLLGAPLAEASPERRVLVQSESYSPRAGDFTFEGYLVMIWVSVFLLFFLLMLFCCVPWANELDPILYSSLGRDDQKKE